MVEKKNNPTGVRMNEEKLKFVMEKEGLKTKQRVINFLLDKYWWEQKIGVVPTLELQKPQTTAEEPKEEIVDDFKTKTERKINEYENELKMLGAGSPASQRRLFIQKELAALRRLLN